MTTAIINNSKYNEDQLLAATCSGSIIQPKELILLGASETHFLVKYPGGSFYDRSGRHYCSPSVKLYEVKDAFVRHLIGPTVWDCARDKNGPLTAKRRAALVEKYLEGAA
ncbi:MAG: hypothetical protein AAGF24_11480 [Cyanobacteria bacterium P01_H01_bin.121]